MHRIHIDTDLLRVHSSFLPNLFFIILTKLLRYIIYVKVWYNNLLKKWGPPGEDHKEFTGVIYTQTKVKQHHNFSETLFGKLQNRICG